MNLSLAVIFDIDGVLIDSYEPHFESWRRIAGQHGVDYTEAMFAKGFGRTSREIIAEDWDLPNLSSEEISAIDQAKEAAYREIVADNFPAMPGASELVRVLHEAGFKIAVGSSGPRENVELAIEQLGIRPYLGAAISGQDVTRGKPDPQIFLRAAETLGVPPGNCAVIEDAPAGLEAARAAEMVCVGFPSTGHSPADLLAADLVITQLADLSPNVMRDLINQPQPR